jgi:hypothetical protein
MMQIKNLAIISLLAMSLSADFNIKPTFISLSGLEPGFGLKDNYYQFEKNTNLSTDVNGIAFFIPKFIENSSVSYSSRVIGENVDAFVFKGDSVNLCSNFLKIQLFPKTTDLELGKAIEAPYQTLVNVKIENFNDGYWLYLYPKTKRDHIQSTGGYYSVHPVPIVTNLNFKFQKDRIDNFINSNNIFIQKCEDGFTYLNKTDIDSNLKDIYEEAIKIDKDTTIELKKDLSGFSSLEDILEYLYTLKSDEKLNSISKISSLEYKIKSAQKRFNETKNLCHYINYIITLDNYKLSLNQKVTITNSCPNDTQNINNYIKNYITGYVIRGELKELNNKYYIVLNSGEVKEFDKENGCFLEKAKTVSNINIENTPIKGYFIDTYDWNNDAKRYNDCLMAKKDTLEIVKLKEFDKDNQPVWEPLTYKGIHLRNIIVFNKSNTNIQEISSYSSSSKTSDYSNYDMNSNSLSGIGLSSNISFPDDNTNSYSSYNSNSYSSSSSFVSSSFSNSSVSSISNSNLTQQESQKEDPLQITGKEFPIDGYFIHFGKGAFDWIYIDKQTSKSFKLEGMDERGYFKWKPLDDIKVIYKGDKVVFEKM